MENDDSWEDNEADSVPQNTLSRKKVSRKKVPKRLSGIRAKASSVKPIKNPSGFSANEILQKLAAGELFLNSPAEGVKKAYSARYWNPEYGMKFIYYEPDSRSIDDVVPNWYFCCKCGYLTNTILGGGNSTVAHHANSHLSEKYVLNRKEISKLIVKCYEQFGVIIKKKRIIHQIPIPAAWSLEFVSEIKPENDATECESDEGTEDSSQEENEAPHPHLPINAKALKIALEQSNSKSEMEELRAEVLNKIRQNSGKYFLHQSVQIPCPFHIH